MFIHYWHRFGTMNNKPIKMINQLEVPMYLEEALPEIGHDLLVSKKTNAYDIMNTLISFTFKHIKQHDFKIVKRCFKIADKLYNKGNKVVKSAIENVFVYSFTKMFLSYPAEKQTVLAMVPMPLYSIYVAQIHHNGC